MFIIFFLMNKLEDLLDKEVENYLEMIEDKEEVKNLLSGNISEESYKKFLKTFYVIEYLSQRAVNMASINTEESNPYLSKRFHKCAVGELGHAEIALKDLKNLGENKIDISQTDIVEEYDSFLQEAAEDFPLGILGHSYLFETVSAILFNKDFSTNYPSKFIEVHAKEDPGHSIAIKRTLREVEKDIDETEITQIINFSNKSGEFLIKLFDQI